MVTNIITIDGHAGTQEEMEGEEKLLLGENEQEGKLLALNLLLIPSCHTNV